MGIDGCVLAIEGVGPTQVRALSGYVRRHDPADRWTDGDSDGFDAWHGRNGARAGMKSDGHRWHACRSAVMDGVRCHKEVQVYEGAVGGRTGWRNG